MKRFFKKKKEVNFENYFRDSTEIQKKNNLKKNLENKNFLKNNLEKKNEKNFHLKNSQRETLNSDSNFTKKNNNEILKNLINDFYSKNITNKKILGNSQNEIIFKLQKILEIKKKKNFFEKKKKNK